MQHRKLNDIMGKSCYMDVLKIVITQAEGGRGREAMIEEEMIGIQLLCLKKEP